MTEDEVAIMVKNVLCKAWRAMNNSSPVSDDDDDDNDNDITARSTDDAASDDSSLPKFRGVAALDSISPVESTVSDEVDFGSGAVGPSATTSDERSEISDDDIHGRRDDGSDTKGDLAKRIEEIQSARAFAEKRYYSRDQPSSLTKKAARLSSSSPTQSPSHHSQQKPPSPSALSRSRGSIRRAATDLFVDTEVRHL